MWPTGGPADRLAGGHFPRRGSGRQPQAGQPADVLQVSRGNLKWSSFSTILAIYGLMIYPAPLNAFDACKSIARENGRGLSPGNQTFLGPVKGFEPSGECHLGLKSRDFQGPTPLPLAQVMDLPVSKALRTGLYLP